MSDDLPRKVIDLTVVKPEPVIEGTVLNPPSAADPDPDGTMTIRRRVIHELLLEWEREALRRDRAARSAQPLGPKQMINSSEASMLRACSERLVSVLAGDQIAKTFDGDLEKLAEACEKAGRSVRDLTRSWVDSGRSDQR